MAGEGLVLTEPSEGGGGGGGGGGSFDQSLNTTDTVKFAGIALVDPLNIEGNVSLMSLGMNNYLRLETANQTDQYAGTMVVKAGDSEVETGGSVEITGGLSTDSDGGSVTISGGTSVNGAGGSMVLQAGSSDADDAGEIDISAGWTADGAGGGVTIRAGYGTNNDGGDVDIIAGDSNGSGGSGGSIQLTAGYSSSGNPQYGGEIGLTCPNQLYMNSQTEVRIASGGPVDLSPSGALKINGTTGYTGTFVAGAQTVTVTKGIITGVI